MNSFLAISLGAIIGANARYVIGLACARAFGSDFPYGTLIINITGSFILGLFLTWSAEKALIHPDYNLLVAVGFCGGYTTFSSYSFEAIKLLQEGRMLAGSLYILQSNVLSLLACLLGVVLARRM